MNALDTGSPATRENPGKPRLGMVCLNPVSYTHLSFGDLLATEGDMAQENKFRFSCEYVDDELGLVYYNYR